GEYLLAIDEEDLKGTDSVFRLLENKAGKVVTLRVGPKPDGAGARDVKGTPTGNDYALRHFAWVTDNPDKATRMTHGRVAYTYLPDTHLQGSTRFVREFYAQVNKDAAVIDERFNGGGFLADQVIDALNRRVRNFVATREGQESIFPRGIFGPKVMIVNE